MAVHLLTNTPSQLLTNFKQAIDEKRVVTWTYDRNGDFTHNTDQWRNKAWLRPKILNDRLVMNIVKPMNGSISWEVYGIFHGRFIESAVVHCNDKFSNGYATSKPANDDIV